MRVFVTPAITVFEAKRRAQEFLQALSEYGAEPVVKNGKYSDGPDHFDINLPDGMNPADLTELLAALGANGVSVQKQDVAVLVRDPLARQGVEQLVEKKLVNAAEIPVEDLNKNLREWSDSLWLDANELTEAQEQEAYDAIVEQLPEEGFGYGAENGARQSGSLLELLDESDEWLKKHAHENPGSSYEPSRWSVR